MVFVRVGKDSPPRKTGDRIDVGGVPLHFWKRVRRLNGKLYEKWATPAEWERMKSKVPERNYDIADPV